MNKSQLSSLHSFGQSASGDLTALPVETMLSVLAFLERAPFRRDSARTRELLVDLLVERHSYDRALRHVGGLVQKSGPLQGEIARACSVRPPVSDPPEPPSEYEELDELDLEPLD